jgi:peroxisomal 3,2-trans-enoyl-CoA isomerase
MFNRKLTAQEAFERNLVTEVVPDELFEKRVLERLTEVSKLPKEVTYCFNILISQLIS